MDASTIRVEPLGCGGPRVRAESGCDPCVSRWSRWGALAGAAIVLAALQGGVVRAQPSLESIVQSRGADSRVDYRSLTRFGPWDDRNYALTAEDLALLAPDEETQSDPIPAFFRVEMRRARPDMRRSGPAQYPRSALQIFQQLHTGYRIDGRFYRGVVRENGRFRVLVEEGSEVAVLPARFLSSEVRVTSPVGAAESAIKVSPVDPDLVIAGSNGPLGGQKMHVSTDGGETWQPAAALPLGGTCCDPTVDWKSDGSLAYAATLGGCGAQVCAVWFYRSSDGGETWSGLESVTPGDPRRELTTSGSDKEYLHVDQHASSPHRDNIYLTWHDDNVLQFASSTDDGDTWSKLSFASDPLGIGSDIATDRNGHVYYAWPAFDTQQIVVKTSSDGGASFAPGTVVVAPTEASYEFAVPSMDKRLVFVYVAAAADLSDGPFAGSVYLAWTDSTGPTSLGNPANNHARIQVAHSRDGGASWTVVTPHETVDAATVDRYHPWLAVGADGKVHVAFYDTRRAVDRMSVDLFYAVSVDGGASFAPPIRLTAQQSPKINDSFEFGDYNGLDTVMNDVIAVFTDNRNEGGGGADSVDVYAAGVVDADRPQVVISTPADGATLPEGTPVSFAGTAGDAQDGDLTSSLAWSSSLDGLLGSGGAFAQTLSEGLHAITASVADSGGLTGSRSIALGVGGLIFADGFESGSTSAWSSP